MNQLCTINEYYEKVLDENKLPSGLSMVKTAEAADPSVRLKIAVFNQLVLDTAVQLEETKVATLRAQADQIVDSYTTYKTEYAKYAEATANKLADFVLFSLNNFKALNPDLDTDLDTTKMAEIAALQLKSRKEAGMKEQLLPGSGGQGATPGSPESLAALAQPTGNSTMNPVLLAAMLGIPVALGLGALHYMSQPKDEVIQVPVKPAPENAKHGK